MAEKKKNELTQAEIEAKQKAFAKKIRNVPISEVAHKLNDCRNENSKRCDEARFAIFLGAGASFQAKIKTAGQMMTEFRAKILRRDCPEIRKKDEQEKWLKKNILSKGDGNEYSKLFEAFERTQRGRQNYISKLIKDKKPTFGYSMLASMIARGFVSTILTTNFDDLMFIACNKFTGVRPVIYAYGIMATEMKFNVPHPKILKMHGDYLYSALANTEREMSYFNQDPNMKAQVSQALNEYELIIFGYSGNDNSVMEILENYPSGKELYWCHWSKELPSLRALELLEKKDGTLVAIEGFDDAMYEIYKVVDFELDEVLASYENRRNEILAFIDQFDTKYSTPVISDVITEPKSDTTKEKSEPITWYDYFKAAFDASERGNLVTAEKYYHKAIELNPKNADIDIFLGNLLATDKSRWAEAETAYGKAIELNPNDADAHIYLGNLLAKDESRQSEAEVSYRKAIELSPNNVVVYNNLGILLAKDESRQSEAEECYRKTLELSPNDADAYNNLGILLAKDESRQSEAEECYRKAIELSPNDADAYNNLGDLLAENESRRAEAEECYRKAIELSPNDADAYNNLGDLLAENESRRAEAEASYRKVIELNPNDTDAYNNLGILLAKDESRQSEAEECYRKAIELNLNDAYAYFNFACLRSLSRKEENKDEAFEFLRKAVELDSKFKDLAKTDTDFDFIRDDERFAEIVGD